MGRFPPEYWAVILGGSSGFGLAAAQKLAEHGMNLCLVHRDRRGAMARIEPEFEKLRGQGIQLKSFNLDALAADRREHVLDELAALTGEHGRVRLLLHSIAFGNLKLIAPQREGERDPVELLAARTGLQPEALREAIDELFEGGADELHALTRPPSYGSHGYLEEEDFARTIYAMGTSILDWTRAFFDRGLFADDARVIGLTSEGNEVAWRGYAAVAAAKVSLEAVSRAIAVEFGPYGIRCNVIQAGITDTAALRVIPGSYRLKAQARLRNPLGRLTTPRDVANAVYLLSTDEAAWLNGEVIRVDGGERISGAAP